MSNEEFVSANFRFLALEKDVKHLDPRQPITWDLAQKLIVDTDAGFCPICLESEPTAPVVTPCGHIFCAHCLLHYLDERKPDNGRFARCPCCHKNIGWDATKFCVINHIRKFETNDDLELLLLERPQNERLYQFHMSTLEEFPHEHFEKFFQRVQLIDDVDSLFAKDLSAVRRALISAHSIFEQPFLMNVEKRILSIQEQMRTRMRLASVGKEAARMGSALSPSKEEQRSNTPSRLLYQSVDGQNIFVDNLNWRCLEHEFGSNLPSRISGKILSQYSVTLSGENRNFYRFLKHLPEFTEVTFVELDLSHLLSSATLQCYKPMIDDRKKKRIQTARREDREKQLAVEREESARLERLHERLLTPMDSSLWKEAPKIEDPSAFPTLAPSRSPPRQPTRNWRMKANSISVGPASARAIPVQQQEKQPVVQPQIQPPSPRRSSQQYRPNAVWGQKQKLKIGSKSAGTRRIVQIQPRGKRQGRAPPETYKPPPNRSVSSCLPSGEWRKLSGRIKHGKRKGRRV